ncbi:oxidoreductase [Glycomyces harbinensis]|uniref:Coenzyme F420-reducing hydrogenase, gamma subunit n=1 Tax=Glycomyces harbinensis TaxID=58114 RepID=A0A1G6XMM3_9ACTN|nr:oxidoreductase [Glycomyces harbinensis]SDD79231.1 Coenzyme F420-reducing hydrogenase, gamma subunit [Glycomyces harbinensis]
MNRPTLAVWKFTSCDGCQLTLLDCEDELLAVAEAVEIRHFPEATRKDLPGPFDVSLVEGSISTPREVERIKRIREESGLLVAIGACATSGGIQALRNFADLREFQRIVYPHPEFLASLEHVTPIATHVDVDYELRGCPIDKRQLVGLLSALLKGRRPDLPKGSVCNDCKRRGVTCLLVEGREPCLGPITQAGCGAICPSYGRGCYGCFGPSGSTRPEALIPVLRGAGLDDPGIVRMLRTYNAAAPQTAAVSTELEGAGDDA